MACSRCCVLSRAIRPREGRLPGNTMARMDHAPHTTEPEVPSNDELVEEIAQGDAEALRTLYRRLSSMVYGLALRIEGNEADAEEVLVDTFYQVWTQARRGTGP